MVTTAKQEIKMQDALRTAITKARGSRKLAPLLGVTRQAIEKWVITPPLQVLAVERLTGVSRSKLRSGIYPASREIKSAKPNGS